MEVKVESKIGKLSSDSSRIYLFLSDCNNFQQLATNDMIKDWQSDSDSCSFSVEKIGSVALRIVERNPGELIKFTIDNAQAENTFLWVQLKNISPEDSRVKITAKFEVNPFMSAIITKPVKKILDKVVDTLEGICK